MARSIEFSFSSTKKFKAENRILSCMYCRKFVAYEFKIIGLSVWVQHEMLNEIDPCNSARQCCRNSQEIVKRSQTTKSMMFSVVMALMHLLHI